MRPLNEQRDIAFLCCFKEKVKIWQPCDKTVQLLIGAIHIEPLFDYKGGDVVETANSKLTAMSTCAIFILVQRCSTCPTYFKNKQQ